MKKIFSVFLLLCMLTISMISCGKIKDIDVDAVVTEITKKYDLSEGEMYSSSKTEIGEFLDEDLIISYYGDETSSPDFSKVEKYCVYLDDSDPKTITDVGIFKLNDASYKETFMKYLQARIDAKIADGKAYPDIDVASLEKSVVKDKGEYVYYIASTDVEKIEKDIDNAFGN